MPRPPRCRRICGAPQVDTFCPNGRKDAEPILLTLDEYEVIRLVDLEQQTHERRSRLLLRSFRLPMPHTGCHQKAASDGQKG